MRAFARTRELCGCVAILLGGAVSWGHAEESKSAAPAAAPSYTPIPTPGQLAPEVLRIEPISDALREQYGLHPFYRKAVVIDGIPIIGSDKVSDYAFLECAWIVDHMLFGLDRIKSTLVESRVRMGIIAATEYTMDIPENQRPRMLARAAYHDRRSRGLGRRRLTTCGEENLLSLRGDPYHRENITIHEFSHTIASNLRRVDRHWWDRLQELYKKAMDEGLWANSYAATNVQEYWAEATQSWFDCNTPRDDGRIHNGVWNREKLEAYDPRLAEFLKETYGDGSWRYSKTTARDAEELVHLTGLDRDSLPVFSFENSPRIQADNARREVERQSAQGRSDRARRPLIAYVGTFSSPLRDVPPTQVDLPPGNGRGIHVFEVDRRSGDLTPAGAYRMGTSPSHLALNPGGTRLYSSNETDRVGDRREGTVSSFAVHPENGQLTLLNTVRSGGAGPTYVSIHPAGKLLLVANYFGGAVAVLPILPDGRLGSPTDVKIDSGKVGPTRATNAPPGSFAFSGHDRTHAHMIQSDPAGRFVLHVDLGLDRIFVWKFDSEEGVLIPNDPSSVSLPPGDGPRHFDFHPNGRWFYSIQEEGSTIVLFDYDSRVGRLTPRQTVSTLPPAFAGSNFCSEILVSADGRFVYAGNRLHDSIGIFSVGPQGDLTFLGVEWTRGDYPRSFDFDPTGGFLYSLNQRADNIAVFQVSHETGALRFTGHYVPVGNPSSIVFLDLARRG